MSNFYVIKSDELYHFGVKGMKWGVRRAIRNAQMNSARRSISDARSRQRQANRELRELNGYSRSNSRIAQSRLSTAIRNHQIRSLNKTNSKLNSKIKDNQSALKELKDIDRYQNNKAKQKAAKKAAANTPEAQAARKAKVKKAVKVGATVVGAASAIYTLNNINNSDAMSKTINKLASVGTKFDKNPAGRLAREAARSDKIAVGAEVAVRMLQGGIGLMAVKEIYNSL